VKSRTRLGIIAGIVVAVAGIASPAMASTPQATLSPSDIASLHSFWSQYGVSTATQAALISEIEAGTPLDASVPGAKPVSETTSTTTTTSTTIDTFADGSIAVVGVAPVKPTPGVASPLVAGSTSCHINGSTSNSNTYACTVSMNTGIVNLSYNASYTSYASAPSRINSATSFQYVCLAGTCAGPYLSVVRSLDQPSLSALAEGGVVYTATGGVGNFDEWLRFSVHNGAASASYNSL
jgi:hypothetical protein